MRLAGLGIAVAIATVPSLQAFASGWDCSADCMTTYYRGHEGRRQAVFVSEPQVTVGIASATKAESFRMLQDSCSREGGDYIQANPNQACQLDKSIPDNDPPTVDDDFIPPGSLGGG